MGNKYYVPNRMKQLDSWGYWKLSKTTDGKLTKLPINATTMNLAKTNDANDWTSYSNCIQKAKEVKQQVSGLSFRFTKEQHITFIDLDHCIENGVINAFAKNICDRFKDTYQELSQSGTGIHIFAIGNIEKAVHTEKIEMYDWGRYVAFTGKCINEKEICDYQEEITKLYEENVKIDAIYEKKELIYDATDEQSVLENIKKSSSGFKFQELFSGMVEKNSENTLALASILAFWTNKNEAMIKDIMLKSGLKREKFFDKRQNITWLDYVIQKAISSCKEVYNPVIKNKYQPKNNKKELRDIEMYGQKLYYELTEIPYSTEQKYRCLSKIRSLDVLIGGFTYDCITLWSSQTNGGKSTMLGMIAKNTIMQGKKVFYFAGEHTKENFQNILYRQIAQPNEIIKKEYEKTGIYNYYIKPEVLRKIENFYFENMYVYNNDCARDIDTLLYAMQECYEKHGVKDFILDNLMQVEISNNDLYREQSEITEKLRTYAINNNWNIHLIAHPRKTAENSIRLTIFDVAGSMNIANRAYNIISIIRKDQLRENTKEYEEIKRYCYHNNWDFDKADSILEVLKQKEGSGTGIVCLKYETTTKCYSELPKENMEYKLAELENKKNIRTR